MNKGQLRKQVEKRLAHNARFNSYEEFQKFLDDVSMRARELGVSLNDLGRLLFIVWVYEEVTKPVIWGMTNCPDEAERLDDEAKKHYEPHTTSMA